MPPVRVRLFDAHASGEIDLPLELEWSSEEILGIDIVNDPDGPVRNELIAPKEGKITGRGVELGECALFLRAPADHPRSWRTSSATRSGFSTWTPL